MTNFENGFFDKVAEFDVGLPLIAGGVGALGGSLLSLSGNGADYDALKQDAADFGISEDSDEYKEAKKAIRKAHAKDALYSALASALASAGGTALLNVGR